MNAQVWGEITWLVGQGNEREAISLLSLPFLTCKMRINNSPYFTGIEGMAAQCGCSTDGNYYCCCCLNDYYCSVVSLPLLLLL